MMNRITIKEIIDSRACPQSLLDNVTDALSFMATHCNNYKHVAPLLRQALIRAGHSEIVDLCSGGGQPWDSLLKDMGPVDGKEVRVVLTDFRPSRTGRERADQAKREAIRYHPVPVDAKNVPAGIRGFRTMFGSFHHFTPEDARTILENTVQTSGIGIFEYTERRPAAILFMLTALFLPLILTPFMRPFRWSRIFWTYLLPVLPFVLAIDGVISCMKTYSPEELEAMVHSLTTASCHWEIGQTPTPWLPLRITYLIGYPEPQASSK